MHIDLIDQLIKENRFDDFKLAYKGIPLNAHHKALVFEKCFHSGQVDFIDYMSHQISLNNEQLTDILIDSFKSPINQTILKYFDKLNDTDVVKKIDSSIVEALLKNQSSDTFNWLLDKFPLTVFKNFKAVAYSCIKNDKYELIEPLLKTKLDTATCFNICLCCFEYKKPDLVNKFLKDQIIVNSEVINELKNNQSILFKKYMQEKELRAKQLAQWQIIWAARAAAQALKDAGKKKKKNIPVVLSTPSAQTVTQTPKPEQLNSFFEENLAKALHEYLAEKFPEKANDKPVRKSKI